MDSVVDAGAFLSDERLSASSESHGGQGVELSDGLALLKEE